MSSGHVECGGATCRARAAKCGATLLHSEDDAAGRVYYFATDAGDFSSELGTGTLTFILRAQGVVGSPLGAQG